MYLVNQNEAVIVSFLNKTFSNKYYNDQQLCFILTLLTNDIFDFLITVCRRRLPIFHGILFQKVANHRVGAGRQGPTRLRHFRLHQPLLGQKRVPGQGPARSPAPDGHCGR